jgi:signal peptidase II
VILRFGLIVAIAAVLLDRVSKWRLIEWLREHGPSEITGFFNLVYVRNTGISFGLGNDGSISAWIPSLLALAIVIFLLFWLRRAQTRWLGAAIGLVIGGAVGNVIDRVLWGAVADFFDFHAFGYHWPAFNVADMAIFIGVVMILTEGYVTGRKTSDREGAGKVE